MRISELSRTSGVSVPTIKYYVREGLLPHGHPTAATQADYTEDHLTRLRLIRALVDVGGLPLASVKTVLAAVDAGPHRITDAVATAHEALSQRFGTGQGADPRALAVVDDLGWHVDPQSAVLVQLGAALAALDDVGMPADPQRLRTYARAALAVARQDVAEVPSELGADAVEFVVLGTVLYEPVLLALRRLAQQHVYAGGVADRGPNSAECP